MSANGRLAASELAPIPGTSPRPGGRPLLRRDAARAYNALHAESMRRWGISMALQESTIRRAYRELDAQWRAWRTYGPGRAARPGTSNHGWGINVDLMNRRQRWVIDQIGHRYGFSKRWSDAPHEWWHITFKPGVWKPPARDAYAFLTAEERRKYLEYRRLKRANRNRARRRVLWAWFVERRKAIWRAAQRSGWGKYNRRRRYEFFNNLTRS